MRLKNVVLKDYVFSVVDGHDTVLIPGGVYALPYGEANELIDRGLADGILKQSKKTTKTKTTAPIEYASDSVSSFDGRKRVSKSGQRRRKRKSDGNGKKRRKPRQTTLKSEP